AKHHKSVIIPELELALKKFILIYQSRAVLNEAILIKKVKQLAKGLGQKLHGEESSANIVAITNALSLLR
ncbi:13351_t:CDS:2, partial [Dentiscutata heterogama]